MAIPITTAPRQGVARELGQHPPNLARAPEPRQNPGVLRRALWSVLAGMGWWRRVRPAASVAFSPAPLEVVVAAAPRRSMLEPLAALVRAYSANARMNQYLVERLDPAVWRAELRGGQGDRLRTIAALVAHLHNCGLRYLTRTDPAAHVPGELDRLHVTRTQAARALGAKRKAVLRVVPAAIAAGRRIVGFPHDAASFLIYYLAHDSHHRGQILLQARLLGYPVSRDTMIGLWQWSARAKE